MLENLFGRPPVVFYASQVGELLSATEFVASNDGGAWARARRPETARLIRENPPAFPLTSAGAPPPATDDWPYVYHRGRTIPRTYLTVCVILAAIAFLATRGAFKPRRASTWSFLLLGAGFLLLETQMISRLALYFGSTWLVNCVALSAILFVLMLANLSVRRRPGRRLAASYASLVASLLAIYLLPWDSWREDVRVLGTLLAAAYGVPLYFAGVIFTETFRRAKDKPGALGSNILGSVAGGLAQNLSFVLGLKALLLPAAAAYALAGALAAED